MQHQQQSRTFQINIIASEDDDELTEVECELLAKTPKYIDAPANSNHSREEFLLRSPKSIEDQDKLLLYQNHQKQQGRQKDNIGVSFDDEAYLVYTIHRQDYTISEHENCWYNRRELIQMKQDNKPTLKLMMSKGITDLHNSIDDDSEQYCTRGLECCILEGASARKTNRWNASLAVFKEQLKQRKQYKELRDMESIARAYTLAGGEDSRRVAYEVGLLDQEQVLSMLALQRQMTMSRNNQIQQHLKERQETPQQPISGSYSFVNQ